MHIPLLPFRLPSSPWLRQLLGGIGGAAVALAIYGLVQLIPVGIHASAPMDHAATQQSTMDHIGSLARAMMAKQSDVDTTNVDGQ